MSQCTCYTGSLRKDGRSYGFKDRLGGDWERPKLWSHWKLVNSGIKKLLLCLKVTTVIQRTEIPKCWMNKWLNNQVLHLWEWLLDSWEMCKREWNVYCWCGHHNIRWHNLIYQYSPHYQKGQNCPNSHPQGAPIKAWSEPLRISPTDLFQWTIDCCEMLRSLWSFL